MEPLLSGRVPDGQVDPLAPDVQLLVQKRGLERALLEQVGVHCVMNPDSLATW